MFCGLSALRLCVWLFDNRYMKLFDTDKHFTFAFETKEWEIVKYRVLSDFKSCFALAHRTQEPFKRLFLYSGHCSLSLFLIVTVGPRQLATSSVNIGAKLRSDIDANSCIMNDTAKGLYSCVA